MSPIQAFAGMYHTSTAQLAELAAQAKPKLLVLYHLDFVPAASEREISRRREFLARRAAR
jgi:ribonuclease BN (tRNA processing enzyme)